MPAAMPQICRGKLSYCLTFYARQEPIFLSGIFSILQHKLPASCPPRQRSGIFSILQHKLPASCPPRQRSGIFSILQHKLPASCPPRQRSGIFSILQHKLPASCPPRQRSSIFSILQHKLPAAKAPLCKGSCQRQLTEGLLYSCHIILQPLRGGKPPHLRTGAHPLCHCVTSPRTVGSNPLHRGGIATVLTADLDGVRDRRDRQSLL